MKTDILNSEEETFLSDNEINIKSSGFFSKMEKGSLRGTNLILIISALGTGFMTLHHFFDEIGIIPGIFSMFLICLNYMLASDILIFAFKKTGPTKSLNEMIEKILNFKWRVFFDITFFIYLFLAMVAVVLAISKTIYNCFGNSILGIFGIDIDWNNTAEKEKHFGQFNFYSCIFIGIVYFILIMQKSLDKFRYISFYSFIVFIYIILVLIIEMPFYYKELKKDSENNFNFYNLTFSGFFQNLGLSIFAYNCLTLFTDVTKTVKVPSKKRLRTIFFRTFIILLILLLLIGLVGYISVGEKNAKLLDLIIYREKIGSSDYFMTIGKFVLIFVLFINLAINTFPLKTMMAVALKWEISSWRNIVLSLTNSAAPVLFALVFTNISDYVRISGCLSGTIIIFIIPGVIAIKNRYCKSSIGHFIIWAWTLIMCFLSILCTYFTADLIYNRKSN